MMRWFKSTPPKGPAVVDELAEARASAAGLMQELIEAQEVIARLTGDLAVARQEAGQAKRERDTARHKLGDLMVRFEERTDRAVVSPPVPRSPVFELALERARADALAERVRVLQEANMRADCSHRMPVWRSGSES